MKNNSYLSTARQVLETEGNALLATAERVGEAFDQAIELIANNPGKVVVLGLGKSGHVAKKMAATFCSTGTPAVFLHAGEALHGDLGIYKPGDVTIAISKGGSTSELVRLIPALREFDSPVIGVLGNINSPLGRLVDVVLDASVPEEADPLGIVPTTSSVIAMAMGDALASALMLKQGFEEQDFARFHPEGQLGRNLLLQVKDAMHRMREVAAVTPEDSLHDVVIRMTEFPLGAACVLDSKGGLLGVICDGDIRRVLQKKGDIRGLTARDVMVEGPTCVAPAMTLGEAVRVMEERPSQISVVPVWEASTRECLGLLRIHDVYQPHSS